MMPKAKTEERFRLHLAVSQQVKERLDRLLEASEAETTTEVIRNALRTYELLLETAAKGGRVILENRNKKAEVLRLV